MESGLSFISFIFLVVLFVLLPRAALRSARQLRQARLEGREMPRVAMFAATAFSLGVVWALAAVNATALGRSVFLPTPVGAMPWVWGAAALALLLVGIPVARALRTPEEERTVLRLGFVPRTDREMLMFAGIAILAGLAEESAYRGVAVWVLTPIFHTPLPAIFLSAMAFAVAHAVQGGKAMAITFAMALVFHGLVSVTGTLVVAMVVHAIYDVIAGQVARRHLAELDAADAAAASAPTPGRTASP